LNPAQDRSTSALVRFPRRGSYIAIPSTLSPLYGAVTRIAGPSRNGRRGYDLRNIRALFNGQLGADSPISIDGAMIVSPPIGTYVEETIGVVAGNTNWYSQVYDPGVPRARVGVVALAYDPNQVNQNG
jgi:hypothetical protein